MSSAVTALMRSSISCFKSCCCSSCCSSSPRTRISALSRSRLRFRVTEANRKRVLNSYPPHDGKPSFSISASVMRPGTATAFEEGCNAAKRHASRDLGSA